MSKTEIIAALKPLFVTIAGQSIIANPKTFSTGSIGYNMTGKISLEIPSDGNLRPLPVTIAGQSIIAMPKTFSTGSVGYNLTGKITIELPDGTPGRLQCTGNFIIVGSKNGLPEGGSIKQLQCNGNFILVGSKSMES